MSKHSCFFFESLIDFVHFLRRGFPVHVREVDRSFPAVAQIHAPVNGSVVGDDVFTRPLNVPINMDLLFTLLAL